MGYGITATGLHNFNTVISGPQQPQLHCFINSWGVLPFRLPQTASAQSKNEVCNVLDFMDVVHHGQ